MGNYYRQPWTPPAKEPEREKPTKEEDRLYRDYSNLRLDCIALEEFLGSDPHGMSEKDLKRLDKAVTVMKVAFKLIARVLRRHGYDPSRKRLPAALKEPSQ